MMTSYLFVEGNRIVTLSGKSQTHKLHVSDGHIKHQLDKGDCSFELHSGNFVTRLSQGSCTYGISDEYSIQARKLSIQCGNAEIIIQNGNISIKTSGNIDMSGTDINLTGQNIKLNSTNLTLQGTNTSINGTKIAIDGQNLSIDSLRANINSSTSMTLHSGAIMQLSATALLKLN